MVITSHFLSASTSHSALSAGDYNNDLHYALLFFPFLFPFFFPFIIPDRPRRSPSALPASPVTWSKKL